LKSELNVLRAELENLEREEHAVQHEAYHTLTPEQVTAIMSCY